MHLKEIHIVNYRNLKDFKTNFHPRLNIINGLNGMGKTNILDAIYYLAITKSYFQSMDKYNIREGENFSRLVGHFKSDKSPLNIICKIQLQKSKIIEKNGKAYPKASDHIGTIPIVMMAPKDQELIYEGSIARRAFLNNTISQMDDKYLISLLNYNHFLKQRNAYLKQLDKSAPLDHKLLNIYNERLIVHADYIFKRRKHIIESLSHSFQKLYREISQNNENAYFSYKSQLSNQSLADLLQENLEKDRILKRTTAGIHKDDLVFHFNDKNLKNIASQGQQKSFILALKLSQYDILASSFDNKPIILLDDVFDKLDQQRVMHLIKLLMQKELGQVFITDTDTHRLELIMKELTFQFSHYVIENGHIAEFTNSTSNEKT